MDTPSPSAQPGRLEDYFGVRAIFAQAFAWNPSAPGVKSEDTFILLTDGRKEIITKTPQFPPLDLSGSTAEGDPDVTKSGIMPA